MGYKCFYHSSDLDGKCSAAIVKYKYPIADLYPIDYYNSVEIRSETRIYHFMDSLRDSRIKNENVFSFTKEDIVIMCDFCFTDFNLMFFIKENCKNFIWLDHHYSAINKSEKYNFETNGILDEESSGCMLTWKYFFPEKDIPYCVNLIDKYDTGDFYFNDDVLPFEYGMRNQNDKEILPNNLQFWTQLFENKELINRILNEGRICLRYQKKLNKKLLRNAFRSNFEGWRCVVVNSSQINSLFFNELEDRDKYDILISCSLDVKGNWNISLYTEKPYINVAQIAEKYGGGGHKKAAGFKTKEFPF